MALIDDLSLKRAIRALRCLPLNSSFYEDSRKKGLDAEKVYFGQTKYQTRRSKWFRNSSSVESAFRWLITLGVLRREVDGQGLTSKIRLTPLGRKIIELKPELPAQRASFVEKLGDCFDRKRTL